MNESRVFSDPAVIARLEELNVQLVKADFTTTPPEMKAVLKRYKRAQLPVNIIVPANPDAPVINMPEIISPADALQALEEAVALSK